MSAELEHIIEAEVEAVGRDPGRLLDVARAVQAARGGIDATAIDGIARRLGLPGIDVRGLVSFYHFLSERPLGRVDIRLSDCVPCRLAGAERVAAVLQAALGIGMGQTTADGHISLGWTSCIGLCDQGPAALINGLPFVHFDEAKAVALAERLLAGAAPAALLPAVEGDDLRDEARALVPSNIRAEGPVIFAAKEPGVALRAALALTPDQVIARVKAASLCGRGGAGFPTGLKWAFARQSPGAHKVIVCNADEGEPGTFKDRAILVERPGHVIEGMTIAAWAVGAQEGILYLRGEYDWLKPVVQAEIDRRYAAGLLGEDIAGVPGFSFSLRIQSGAGAYICGEESALIESCEGKRGCPRHRPPFPVQRGYKGLPTVVNNVETFCVATDLLHHGYASVARLGAGQSRGTKLFSVSGDCARPGVWELPFGLTLREFLEVVGGQDAQAVQVGGPSGRIVPPADFDKRLAFEELATGGSMIVIGPGRDLLQIASWFMAFFVEESCGWCVPCRVGNVLIKERLDRIIAGQGLPEDLPYLEELCETVKATSRCGLGQTSPNPVLTTLRSFRSAFEARLLPGRDRGRQPTFDLDQALREATRVQGRAPVFHDEEQP
ncbi:MAG: NAD(P)H-dependent oxidoreductase subunit E [Pseudomonadota bacterium]